MATWLKITLLALIAAALAGGILLANYHRLSEGGDRGFMARPCTRGEPRTGELRGRPEDYPLPVRVEPEAAEYLPFVELAVDWVNEQAGRRLYMAPVPASPHAELEDPVAIVTRTNSDGRSYDPLERPAHLFWDADCRIRRVVVRVPGLAPPEYLSTIITHELLHGLGLDHDEEELSIMHERIVPWGSRALLPGDRARLARP